MQKRIFDLAKQHINALSTTSESFSNIHCIVPNKIMAKIYLYKKWNFMHVCTTYDDIYSVIPTSITHIHQQLLQIYAMKCNFESDSGSDAQ